MPIFLFVVILTVVAGLVAAGGDRMGHRAARRKLRIGNLRPRTVSTIIAVVTGILISLVTFGVVFAIWSDFREALLRYRDVKASLAQVQSEVEGMQDEVDAARVEVAQARDDREAALAASEELNSQLSDMRGQTFELAKAIDIQQQELDAKLAEVQSLQRQIGGLKRERDELEQDIANLEENVESWVGREADLRELFEQARTEREAYLEGDVLIPRGAYLAYQVVHAGEQGDLSSILQRALNRVNVNLAQDGLAIDRESESAAEEFIGGYGVEGEAVIVISAARNVFAGTDVLLQFEAVPLTPLVNAGDVVMDVNVGSTLATVRSVGVGRREITVPEQFDVVSLTDLSVILQSEMIAASSELGFLPDLRTGDYETPVAALAEVANDIIARERPFVIQFVATRPLNALDGLADVEIYISNP